MISSYTVSTLVYSWNSSLIQYYLLGARSKNITKIAYWKVFNVTQECKESSFIKEKFLGYNKEWIRYGYFELTNPIHIETTQNFIILKKVDILLWLQLTFMIINECRMVVWSKDLVCSIFWQKEQEKECNHLISISILSGSMYLFRVLMEKDNSPKVQSICFVSAIWEPMHTCCMHTCCMHKCCLT